MNRTTYPVDPEGGIVDRAVQRLGTLPIRCPVCGSFTVARGFGENLRETGVCRTCRSTNRNRQLASVAARVASEHTGRSIRTLPSLSRVPGYRIYNTEAAGPLHEAVRTMPGYRCSEYFGPEHASGELVGGILHEDLMDLSFADESFDQVWSSDVLEHVPDPYRAHREVYRVLRTGGHHVFTVPFHQDGYLDDVRARLGADGEIELLAPAMYHDDPVNAGGVLVYTIFSLEMLVRLAEIGFTTRMYRLREPWSGIVGANALVFDAVKVAKGG